MFDDESVEQYTADTVTVAYKPQEVKREKCVCRDHSKADQTFLMPRAHVSAIFFLAVVGMIYRGDCEDPAVATWESYTRSMSQQIRWREAGARQTRRLPVSGLFPGIKPPVHY